MQYLVKFLHEVCEVHAVFRNIFAEFLGEMVTFYGSLGELGVDVGNLRELYGTWRYFGKKVDKFGETQQLDVPTYSIRMMVKPVFTPCVHSGETC
jgi:hypothetical protein